MHDDSGFKLLVSHTWRVENFSLWNKVSILKSYGFVVESMPETEFHLALGQSESHAGRVECHLTGTTVRNGATSRRIRFEILILAADGTTFRKMEKEMKPFVKTCSESLDAFALDEDLEGVGVLPKDVLTIVCRMWEVWWMNMTDSITVTEKVNRYRSNHFPSFSFRSSREIAAPKAPVWEATSSGRPILIYDFYMYNDSAPDEMGKLRLFSNTSRFPVMVEVTVHLLDVDKCRCLTASHRHVFWKDLQVWFYPEFIPISMLLNDREKYFRNDKVTLEIDILYSFTDSVPMSHWCGSNSVTYLQDVNLNLNEEPSKKRKRDLKQDMQTMLKKGKFTDLVLMADGKQFRAHKAILSARSPVFEAMFGLDMAEKQKSVVDIQDMDSDTLERLLAFLYSETFQEDDLDVEGASYLYLAADKYNIRKLKLKCSEFLRSRVTNENVCDILVLAHFHGDRSLKMSAMKKLSACIDSIILTDKWASLVSGQSTLAESTIQYLRSKR